MPRTPTLLTLATLLTVPAAGLAQEPAARDTLIGPLSREQRLELAREAIDAFASASHELQNNERFRDRLVGLVDEVGLEWTPPPLAPGPYDRLRQFAEAGDVEGALALIRAESDRDEQILLRHVAISTFVEARAIELAFRMADSLRSQRSVAAVFLRSPSADSMGLEAAVALVETYLRDAGLEESDWIPERGIMLERLALQDFDAAWARAFARPTDYESTTLRMMLLTVPLRGGIPEPAARFRETFDAVLELPEGSARDQKLHSLRESCTRFRSDCSSLPFPEVPVDDWDLPHAIGVAFRDRHLDLADSLLTRLRPTLPRVDFAHTVANGLAAVEYMCRVQPPCPPEVDAMIDAWTPELLTASREEPASATRDDLNGQLSRLLSGRAPEESTAAVLRIDDPDKQFTSGSYTAERLLEAYPEAGVALYIRLGPRNPLNTSMGPHYQDAMSHGDEERAEELLDLMDDSVERMLARMRWGVHLHRAGRFAEARETAMSGLDTWEPARHTMSGSWGSLQGYIQLGLYDEVVAWARALEDPTDRAVALTVAATNVSMLRPIDRGR